MKSDIRTFKIRDASVHEDESVLAEFLRTVEVQRIETTYADGAWRILVMYEELRRREETAQIQSAIVGALNAWRNRTASEHGLDREAVLTDAAVQEIARYAPTTAVELAVIAGGLGIDATRFGTAIVQVVRQTLEELID